MDIEQAKAQEARKRSVDNLQRLYTVVVSLAVTELMKRLLVDPHSRAFTTPSSLEATMLIAFFVTVVPFYHGANRYLDAVYVTDEREPKPGALMIDFLALFGEAILIFALGMSAENLHSFYLMFIVLLVWDIIWVWSTHFTSSATNVADTSYNKWLLINSIVVLVIFFLGWSQSTAIWPTQNIRGTFLAVVALVRTVLDYSIAWTFYYPQSMRGKSDCPDTKVENVRTRKSKVP